MSQQTHNDDATEMRLRLLIGLVVVTASGAIVTAVTAILFGDAEIPSPALLATLIFLTGVGSGVMVRVRIGATRHGISWTDTAILIGLAVAPVPWVVISTAIGVALSKIIARVGPQKMLFGVGKDTLMATAAGVAYLLLGGTWDSGHPPVHVGALAGAIAALTVVDEAVSIPVIALATRTRARERFRSNWDFRVISLVGRFAVAIAALMLLARENQLLLAVPPLVLSLHLAYLNRLKGRAEREAWQKLAGTTEALNDVDLDTVLKLGVTRSAELFSADQVEVETWIGDRRRLVRGGVGGLDYDGEPADAPPGDPVSIDSPLEGHDASAQIGMLRLRFRGAVTLSERESYTLRTFASALCTAVRNASAYAELERAAREHAHAAAHDALTGLTNRRSLLDRGNELLRSRNADGVLALLLIDLNHFKEVNDTLGHAAGDRVLIGVADRLREAAGPDDIVARLGGDEFAVLLARLPAPAVAAHRADRLLAALYQPIEVEGMRISVEASGGIAVASGTGGMAELLRRADVAMYQAKRTGQRIATYARARDTADVGRLTLGGDLPRAVAEHQFVVNFQPIVDLATGEVVSAEALARWHHPARGDLDPRRFLDAVERSGLLPAFADAVLDLALIAAADWREAGFDIPVAVNVSPRSLLDARFPSTVAARLRAHGVPADRRVLELTETLTISQLEVVDQVLGQLRDSGVRLALDDFGTGYSSLSVLSRIPVHELKIDREFVRTMESSPEAAAVVRSTVDLGRSLDLEIVAEGVESEPQRHALWELGCAAGQGHLFARPMPAGRLLAAMRRGSGGRAGTLAAPLHDEGAVIRIPNTRRPGKRGGTDRLPHLPA
ncbi:MAG TPA: bifunctional diguanylate cyclase/phosphodiesterase [Micromonosporaceae bacterium]|nr:bifunctional diguanylate cyclase/phosphodiesterase [Micromonosporaceae bacterium]